MLYAFGAQDLGRIRRLLAAYEQGRLLVDTPPAQYPSQAGRQDTILGHVTTAIPGATVVPGPPIVTTAGVGTAYFVKVDYTTGSPVLTDVTNTDKTYTVLNYGSLSLPIGYYLLAREPTSGNYIPATHEELLTWSSSSSLIGGFLSGAVSLQASIALPYAGTYLATFDLGIRISGNPGSGTEFGWGYLQPTPFSGGSPDFVAISQLGNAGVDLTEGSGSITKLFTVSGPGTSIGGYASTNAFSTTAVVTTGALTVTFLSPGALPSAVTVNGLTGGVNINPVSGGGGGAGGGGNTTPAGTVLTTSGTTVAVGLSSAALAAINSYLASMNL
jgi:hypothetical protein